MKKIFIALLMLSIFTKVNAQNLNDFGRITISSYIPDKLDIPQSSKNLLDTKLKQIVSNYGMAGENINSRFIITANIKIGTKEMDPGPPQLVSQNITLTLFIGDAVENKIFSNISFELMGVGGTLEKSFIVAFKNIKTKSAKLETFISTAKNKIIDYYNTSCALKLKETDALVNENKYNEALYKLSMIPNVCEDCYVKALAKSNSVYVKKINYDGEKALENAKSIWASNPNSEGAQQVKRLLLRINKKATCYSEVPALEDKIEKKLTEDEKVRIIKEEADAKREHEMALENAKNDTELEELRINAYREIAVEYARNQPQVRYYRVYW